MRKLIVPLLLTFTFSFLNTTSARAGEGMWLPVFLKQLNEEAMVKTGLKIPVEKIYSINQSSLKDAVVLFGGGCTGEIISDKGLLLTNHHCGFSSVQSQSSVDHDYITSGYWAMTPEEELPIPNLTVTFIIRIDDVSDEINKALNDSMSEAERENKIRSLSQVLEQKATQGTHYTAKIKPYFSGNRFFLTVMEVFKDIRLVGAPPNALGDFGGDTDNWMFPRHTADFSLFRVYAGKDNKPAAYSKDNIPFVPRYHFTISLKGVAEGDFTMVYGFPGTTQEYLPSYAINIIEKDIDPNRVKIRETRLEIMRNAMHASDTVRIQYADKERKLNNYYKKWKGEIRGLEKRNTVETKQTFESEFSSWAAKNKPALQGLLPRMEKSYSELRPYAVAKDYYTEAIMGIELIAFAKNFMPLAELSATKKPDEKELKAEADKLKAAAAGFFKNYDVRLDKKVFAKLMRMYVSDVEKTFYPVLIEEVKSKYKNDFDKYATRVYSKSIFASQKKLDAVLDNYSARTASKITGDPGFVLMKSFIERQQEYIDIMYDSLSNKIKKLNRLYMAAQMEMQPQKKFYPDANLTLRVTYGQVKGYSPRDAVENKYSTTLDGLIEKEDSVNQEFSVPQKLKELYAAKEYGRYGSNGILSVNFIADNHTTGGNSGSPVINANGELIGTNFDRTWEGTVSDLDYNPGECRNISLDIRYTLFLVDKFAGCKRLIDEMTFSQ